MPSAAAALKEWHDFFVVIGAAAATLIGAMFVVVSIGSGFLTRERAAATRAFLTPTMLHLSTVLFGCALAVVPSLDWTGLGLVFGLVGLAGLAYSAVILRRVGAHQVDWADRLWYAGAPPLGYAIMAAAAGLGFHGAAASLDLLAAALALILVAGMRNAWDMILFLIAQARGPG